MDNEKSLKGAAIKLPHGSDPADAVRAVETKFAEKLRSPRGWYGTAVVNVSADEKGNGAQTYIVKATASGFDVFGYIGHVANKVTVTTGKFIPVK